MNRFVPNAERNIAQTQLDVAKELATDIKARAPVRTGRYRASIRGDRLTSGRGYVGGKLRGLRGQSRDPNATGIFAEYIWRFLEFGHHGRDGKFVPGRPHIFPIYRASKRRIRSKISAALRKTIKGTFK